MHCHMARPQARGFSLLAGFQVRKETGPLAPFRWACTMPPTKVCLGDAGATCGSAARCCWRMVCWLRSHDTAGIHHVQCSAHGAAAGARDQALSRHRGRSALAAPRSPHRNSAKAVSTRDLLSAYHWVGWRRSRPRVRSDWICVLYSVTGTGAGRRCDALWRDPQHRRRRTAAAATGTFWSAVGQGLLRRAL